MAGRRPQPVTQAANPAENSFDRPMPQIMGSAVQPMTHPPAPTQSPYATGGGTPGFSGPAPDMTQGLYGSFQNSPMSRPMPQQSVGPRVTNGKNGGYRPQQQFNPFGGGFGGGGFGGGCGHGGGTPGGFGPAMPKLPSSMGGM